MCYPEGEYVVGDHDVLLGQIGSALIYISASLYEAWKHIALIIDVAPGSGGMFSLDNGREAQIFTRSPIRAAQPIV